MIRFYIIVTSDLRLLAHFQFYRKLFGRENESKSNYNLNCPFDFWRATSWFDVFHSFHRLSSVKIQNTSWV